ncbi:MAG: 23S rRNA (guanosine(2251)-2'-O)-methyltransferase RlmB [Flavobacteriales bacterium]|nr:23S rRNA (guanosine(2251)-2'-O)-methyltransferase RlmB [Flavobacteriales bacterium]
MPFDRKEKTGLLTGLRPLIEALRSGRQIDKVLIQTGLKGDLYQDAMQVIKEHDLVVQYVPIEKLDRLTRSNHQGIIALISPVDFYDLGEILEKLESSSTVESFLMLDGITDVRNFGAICRSAECFGVKNIIIPDQGGARVSEDSMKTSAGALVHLKLCKVHNLVDAIYLLQQYGYETIACTEKAADALATLQTPTKWCLVMGSEEKGISTQIIKRVNHLVQIPMTGRTESLNVSVAAGIAVYSLTNK